MKDLPGTSLVPNPLVVAQQTPDGAVLMDTASGECFELNRIGAQIWKLIAEGHAPAQIAVDLAELYTVTPAQVERDVVGLVDKLLRNGILTSPQK